MNKYCVQINLLILCFCFLMLPLSNLKSQNIKVFILAGQSNMQGHGDINPSNVSGTLSNFMDSDSSEMFNYIRDSNGDWATRDDVWVRYDMENGEILRDVLGVGYGGWEGQIGPELGFGHLLGEHCEDQVLLIKTCWGGKSLAVDFRPPSSGGTTGEYYNQIITDINEVIDNIATEFPSYNGEEIEIAGLVWFQGWNDGEQESYLDEYETNLINFIADLRADLEVPNLPVVIGLTGNGGYGLLQGDTWVQGLQTKLVPAQISAAEYDGHTNVCYAETRDFWRGDISPSPSAIHHWNNNAESYLKIGNALGLKMIEKINITNSATNFSIDELNVKVFPTLADRYIQLESKENIYNVNMIDINGRIIQSIRNESPLTEIDVTDLNKGIYFIEVLNARFERIALKKMMKI